MMLAVMRGVLVVKRAYGIKVAYMRVTNWLQP